MIWLMVLFFVEQPNHWRSVSSCSRFSFDDGVWGGATKSLSLIKVKKEKVISLKLQRHNLNDHVR